MAQECGFFNAELEGGEYDRVYNAEQFAAYFASFIGNGIFGNSMSELVVVENETPNMSINVSSGKAWINGWWYRNTEDYNLSVDVADGVLNRIDIVVLRWGNVERDMWLQVIKGTPSANPVAPTITRNADYYDLKLCEISIPAGAVNIRQAQISDTRPITEVCGFVTGLIDQIDAEDLFLQFQAQFGDFMDVNYDDFNTWFNHMKDQLSEDAAGHLQAEIDDINNNIGDVTILPYPDYPMANNVNQLKNEINQINSDLTASGCYNRGKDLTPYVVDGTLWDRIHGTNGFKKYEDIMPWDYINLGKTITAPSSGGGSTTGTNIVRVAQRGGINPYQFGGTPTDCLVMVPDTHFGMSKMNATNDATGGYKSSFMVSTILPNINSQLETTNLAGHIVPTIELITNSINASGWGKLGSASGASNNWELTDGGSGRLAKQKCVLMSEMEVYGGTVFSSSGYDTGNACMQLEAFRNSKDAAMPYPINFWLKDVASVANFCRAAGAIGHASYNAASLVHYVRPRFIIS